MDRPVGELSRGNRQKVGLVQAAFHDPELLVLDEPTAGLDPLMQERFVHFVSEERARGHTVLLSSHDLDEVQRTCDRVGMIRDGRLVAVDAVQELMKRSFRHVAIEFDEPFDASELRDVPGVVDFVQHGRRVTFRTVGAIDAVVKVAARHTVADLELSRPTLDEVFLTFYGDGTEPC
jgi:ABC-2 type transport system ATP-binding protein